MYNDENSSVGMRFWKLQLPWHKANWSFKAKVPKLELGNQRKHRVHERHEKHEQKQDSFVLFVLFVSFVDVSFGGFIIGNYLTDGSNNGVGN